MKESRIERLKDAIAEAGRFIERAEAAIEDIEERFEPRLIGRIKEKQMQQLIIETEKTLDMLKDLERHNLISAAAVVRAIVQRRIEATQAALDTARQAMSAGDADFRHSVSGDAEREKLSCPEKPDN